MFVAVSLFASI